MTMRQICLETAAAACPFAPEGVTAGLLLMMGNIFGYVFIYVVDACTTLPDRCTGLYIISLLTLATTLGMYWFQPGSHHHPRASSTGAATSQHAVRTKTLTALAHE